MSTGDATACELSDRFEGLRKRRAGSGHARNPRQLALASLFEFSRRRLLCRGSGRLLCCCSGRLLDGGSGGLLSGGSGGLLNSIGGSLGGSVLNRFLSGFTRCRSKAGFGLRHRTLQSHIAGRRTKSSCAKG